MDEFKYDVWLAHLYDIGSAGIGRLIEIFGSASEIYRADNKTINNLPGYSQASKDKIIKLKRNVDPEQVAGYLDTKKIRFITRYDENYPPFLIGIDNPPFALFIRGTVPDFDRLWITMVGTRRHSDYGSRVTYNLAKELGEKGTVIVSGMAGGLDGVAHRGALDSGGDTVAVLGCGVDVCYPKSNEALYLEILEKGAIVSEYPPKAPPLRWHFPLRNRIMSALSNGTIVTEAKLSSGTLITADHALEQGKEVFAVPGNITSALSAGCNRLIKDGAHVATCAADVLDVFGMIAPEETGVPNDTNNEEKNNFNGIPLAPDEKRVYALLDNDPKPLDYILMESGLEYRSAALALTNLELGGKIRKLPGQRYVK